MSAGSDPIAGEFGEFVDTIPDPDHAELGRLIQAVGRKLLELETMRVAETTERRQMFTDLNRRLDNQGQTLQQIYSWIGSRAIQSGF